MDALTMTAASGLRAKMESLEMLANNVANAGTEGYKTDREFYSLYVAPEAGASAADGGMDPVTAPVIERPWIDLTQGVLRTTGSPLDMALSGKGFFSVSGPSGPLYTRNGSFRVSAAGLLVNGENYPVRGQGGAVIQTQSSAPLEIGKDGTVLQEGQTLGQLEIVNWDTAGIVKQGTSYFRPANEQVKPAPPGDAEVQQGKLENSNVSSPEAAVRLVSVMRQFEMLQKAVTLGAEMNRRAIEEVARVGS